MDRDIPTFNQLIVNKMNQKNRQLHEQRLQNIRASQHSRSYLSSSMNTRQNKKAQQLEEDKKTEIEKHNLVLFNKMKRIMNRNDPYNKPPLQTNKSGNRTSMDLAKIQEENRTMYERIEKQRPTINNKKLFEERQKHLNILKFLGKYSAHSIQSVNAQNLRTSQASSRTQTYLTDQRKKAYTVKPEHYLENTEIDINPNSHSKPQFDHIQFDEEINDEDFNRVRTLMEAKKKRLSAEHHRYAKEQEEDNEIQQEVVPQRRLVQIKPSVPRSAKDITLYKTTKDIDSCMCEVRILRKHLTYEIRCTIVNSYDSPLTIELDEQQGTAMLQESDYDYKAIIDRLRISNNTLIFSDHSNPKIESGGILRKEQGDIIPQMKAKAKNKLMFANSSHISEQNEEESYHYEMRDKRQKEETDPNELDSLGEQQQFQKYTNEQVHEQHQQFIYKPANFQEKLQQSIRQKSHFQNEGPTPGQRSSLQAKEFEQSTHQNEPNGNYEQALDESVD